MISFIQGYLIVRVQKGDKRKGLLAKYAGILQENASTSPSWASEG